MIKHRYMLQGKELTQKKERKGKRIGMKSRLPFPNTRVIQYEMINGRHSIPPSSSIVRERRVSALPFIKKKKEKRKKKMGKKMKCVSSLPWTVFLQMLLICKFRSAFLVYMPLIIPKERLRQGSTTFGRLAKCHPLLWNFHAVYKIADHAVQKIHRDPFPSR